LYLKVLGMKKLIFEALKIIGFSILITFMLPIGICIVPVPWVLFFPPVLLYTFIFGAYYCFIPILFFSCALRFSAARFPFLHRTYFSGILAMLTCLYIAIQFGVNERGSSEIFGPSGFTYLLLAQGSLVTLASWRFFAGVFWSNDEEEETQKTYPPRAAVSFKRKCLLTLIANLILGNVILYIHEMGGRQQTEVANSLWISFSGVAIILLFISFRVLNKKKSYSAAVILSLVISLLVPILGLFFSMQLSLVALVIGAAYLTMGFYWSLPIFALNLFAFRWAQKV